RDSEGPFETVESLTAVRGVGPATVEGLRELVTIGR
ncbi:MAG: ComEA family DNA-binding protein, partial [Actinobacteria bacterium]|nr:ComEA family DNA-binding protein [Actinomycetota bacterium]NIT94868.1 ComEA family DNA-binding protein [Actinomycetota bacterium]NIU18521.1 ComEA family DNA-binding protein [Actinomycetota bacterium]NIU65367.1 ComEA family DNA-binding protein [Actinomycetota bacterium]NIV54996.1 ComEA family DNA-binding protein [Actinomycetota bacterium]